MRLADHEWIAATPRQTWNALHDPEILRQCLHDCESVQRLSAKEYRVVFDTSRSGVDKTFEGLILIGSEQPPNHLRIAFNGAGEHAGMAIGTADITLEPGTHGGTRFGYELQAATGGALARVGEEELTRRAQRHLGGFFLRLNELADSAPGADPTPEPAVVTSSGRGMGAWLAALVVIAVIVVYFTLLRP